MLSNKYASYYYHRDKLVTKSMSKTMEILQPLYTCISLPFPQAATTFTHLFVLRPCCDQLKHNCLVALRKQMDTAASNTHDRASRNTPLTVLKVVERMLYIWRRFLRVYELRMKFKMFIGLGTSPNGNSDWNNWLRR